jgi:hypothetical protein
MLSGISAGFWHWIGMQLAFGTGLAPGAAMMASVATASLS